MGIKLEDSYKRRMSFAHLFDLMMVDLVKWIVLENVVGDFLDVFVVRLYGCWTVFTASLFFIIAIISVRKLCRIFRNS